MKKPSLYLSGPISGLNWEDSTIWRNQVAAALPEFDCFSPLRGKSYLKKLEKIEGAPGQLGLGGVSSILSSVQGIMTRDSYDCYNCDGTFVNLLGTGTRVTIGTVMEIAWMWEQRKPIIIVMEEKGNIHDHPMIRAATPFFVTNLDDACDIARMIFLP